MEMVSSDDEETWKSSSDEGDSTHECQLAFDLFIGELISVS